MVNRLSLAGFSPADLVAVLGPAIGPCCYEVGSEVLKKIEKSFPESGVVKMKDNEKGFVNLWELNKRSLIKSGLVEHHVEILQHCTFCSPDYFSYRRDGGDTGRQCGIIGMAS